MSQFLESLESRQLLSNAASFSFASGVLTVSGGSKADRITVVEDSHNVHLEISDPAHNKFVTTDLTGVNAINIKGGGQGDAISYKGNSVGADIHGNGGSDEINVADRGTAASTADGDAGDDTINVLFANATGKTTTIYGGSGNDQINLNTDSTATASNHAIAFAEKGNDTVTVYQGTNTINGAAGTDSAIIDLSTGALAANQTLISIENVSYI